MPDLEKARRKKVQEAQVRLDQERQERLIKAQKERSRAEKEAEKQRWLKLTLQKQKDKEQLELAESYAKTMQRINEIKAKNKKV